VKTWAEGVWVGVSVEEAEGDGEGGVPCDPCQVTEAVNVPEGMNGEVGERMTGRGEGSTPVVVPKAGTDTPEQADTMNIRRREATVIRSILAPSTIVF